MIFERRQHRIVALVIFVWCFIKHKYIFLIKSKIGKLQMSKKLSMSSLRFDSYMTSYTLLN